MFKHWKTTLLGVCSLLAAVGLTGAALLDDDPTTNPDAKSIELAVIGLIGIAAADANQKKQA